MLNHVSALCTLGLYISTVLSQSLPYNPTTILLPQTSSKNQDIAYAFIHSAGSNTHQFVSLNISSHLSPTNLSLSDISPSLPFLTNSSNAFIPSISAQGEVSVYTGSCSTSTSSALWRFSPSNTSTNGNGTWAQEITSTARGVTSAALPGADFLSRGFSFSTFVHANASQTKIYVFGGMCPTSQATASSWQSAASYSNHMLRLAPTLSTDKTSTYTLDLPTSRGPPIAEAGFTITGLTPTTSNNSGILTQQQSFVLVGGHTQSAFTNMSVLAIWSLPEESWSFVTVDSPPANGNTELAVRGTVASVDSRSGHTAVLTEDGSSIIVYGGWVGDVSQAADPQLAVLSLGTGFGGSGDWKWSVPKIQPSGSGIYGHGAVMLPGNVMMVLGGYNISTSSTSKRATPATQAMFFNATSMSWVSNYTNPSYIAAIAAASSAASASSNAKSSSMKVGLGAGLGLGLAAVLGAFIVWFCYNRRLKKRRKETQEKNLRDLSLGAAHVYASPEREMSQSSSFPWSGGRWNGRTDNNGPVYDSNSAVAGYENLQAGVHNLGDNGAIPPPPKQIQRKPLHSRNARGVYQPTTAFDFGGQHGRANSLGTAGPIHPIYEADEDDSHHAGVGGVGIALGEPSNTVERNRYSDPFKDPVPVLTAGIDRRDNHSPRSAGESSAQSREREIQEWVSDWAAADMLLNSQTRSHSHVGRISPTRRAQLIAATSISSVSGEEDSGRTASNLSECTDRSVAISAPTVSRSGSSSQGRSRSNSLRGFITGINPFGSATMSTTGPSTTLSPVFDGPPQGPRSYIPPRSAGSGSNSSHSFNTAHTSFPALQAEGESLLPRPDEMSSGEHSPTRSQPDISSSPSKSKPHGLGKGRSGWLGSLKKVFASGEESPSDESFLSREPSPTRYDYGGSAGVEPRRTVSAGATLWRRKQGKSDWEDSAPPTPLGTTGRSNTFTAESSNLRGGAFVVGNDDDEEDWDIERAVQNRVVQVMFTVPKEKLRVVNHDFDEEKSDAGSLGGSLRSKKGSLRAKRSLRDLHIPPPPVPIAATTDVLHKNEEEKGDENEALLIDNREESRHVIDEKTEAPTQKVDKGKGKAKEIDVMDEIRERKRSLSPGKSRVLEMVQEMEGRKSPERK